MDFKSRFDELVKFWPELIKADLNNYMKEKNYLHDNNYEKCNYGYPLWSEILISLDEHLSNNSKISSHQNIFLQDIIWAQFCLILAFRIKDDLYDGEIKSNTLLASSDLLQIESIKTYKKYFKSSDSFWTSFHDSISLTILAAIKVDEMQQNIRTDPDELLNTYYNVISLFNIGISAVCKKYRKENILKDILNFSTNLTLAAQILDDLEDIEEDFSRKRFNYVILKLLNTSPQIIIDENFVDEELISKIILKEGLNNIFDNVFELIQISKTILNSLKFEIFFSLIINHEEYVKLFKEKYHKDRINIIFNELKI
ncbi:MAG: hypothetical protein IPM32_07315 [Ignavibacteriae bacterium]|nr:hypothetical protein [Ignavibacteriota bacterium]